jgi:hypothetical protein
MMMIGVEAMKSAVVSQPGRARADREACPAVGTATIATHSVIRPCPQGMSVGSLLSEANALGVLFGVSRALHITAVLPALVWMFAPAANAYFREKGAYFPGKECWQIALLCAESREPSAARDMHDATDHSAVMLKSSA